MNDFKPFEDKLAGLIAALSPAGRRRMTADIAKKLRQRQQQRIKSQKAPDGSPFVSSWALPTMTGNLWKALLSVTLLIELSQLRFELILFLL